MVLENSSLDFHRPVLAIDWQSRVNTLRSAQNTQIEDRDELKSADVLFFQTPPINQA